MRKVWIYDPHSGGKPIPPATKVRTEGRIFDHVGKRYAGRFPRVDVRFRGALCYIDGYQERSDANSGSAQPNDDVPLRLCRIRFFGDEDRWSYAHYNYSYEKYEPSFLLSGEFHGTPEEAFDTATQFY